MVRNLRQYSKEFKQDSVSLALSYANVNQAAKVLGIPSPTLHEWVTKAKSTGTCVIHGDDGSIKQADVWKLMEENKELRKRLSRLEQEKEILKKAAANSTDHCNTSLNLSAGDRKFNVFRGL